jgi:hypothetical protein
VIGYLTIEEVFEKKKIGVRLSDMQGKKFKDSLLKGKDESIESLKAFSRNVSKNGFSANDFVAIDRNERILYGYELLANALYFDIAEIPVRITSLPLKEQLRNVAYRNIGKYKKGNDVEGMGREDIKIVKKAKEKIFLDNGLYFPGVLWGPVSDYFDEITEKLSSKYKVVFFKDYEFDDEEDFYELLKRLYSWEAIGQNIIKDKFEYLTKHPRVIRFFTLLIDDPAFKFSESRKAVFSSAVKDMKEEYRRIYSKRIENYIRDVVLHIGDNFQHNRHILSVFKDIPKSNII